MDSFIFCIYDSKAGYYRNPFIMTTKGEALRGFEDIANDNKTEIGRHPEDFVLFCIGFYDRKTGNIDVKKEKEALGIAIEFVKKNEVSINRITNIEEV